MKMAPCSGHSLGYTAYADACVPGLFSFCKGAYIITREISLLLFTYNSYASSKAVYFTMVMASA